MIPARVTNHLKKKNVPYKIVEHKKVYTTFDLGQTLGEKLNKIVKTLLIKGDKRYVLVAVPASARLDLNKIKKAIKAKAVEIAKEPAVQKILKVKPGTVVPFGGLHGLEVVFDKALIRAKEVIVRAGSLTESLRMNVKDLHSLENVSVADVAKKIIKVAAKVVKKVKSAKKSSAKKKK